MKDILIEYIFTTLYSGITYFECVDTFRFTLLLGLNKASAPQFDSLQLERKHNF